MGFGGIGMVVGVGVWGGWGEGWLWKCWGFVDEEGGGG